MSGLVTAVSPGNATITVTTEDGGKTAISQITVNAAIIPVTGVGLLPATSSLYVNETQQLTATVLPLDATNQSVLWSSDNTSVATVSMSGLVTAVSPGNATITVTTEDGGKTAISQITVNDVLVTEGLKIGNLNEYTNSAIISDNIPTGVKLFPNPITNGLLNIELTSVKESAILKIIDLSGRVVYNKTLMTSNNIQKLNIKELNPGPYLVRVLLDNKIYTKKIVVK
jgi:transglutaminase/protease-like cytokinesis protein 3